MILYVQVFLNLIFMMKSVMNNRKNAEEEEGDSEEDDEVEMEIYEK